MIISDPFKLLLEIENKCHKNSAGMPLLDEIEEEWIGVEFRVGDDYLVAAMSEVEEILDVPEYTSVPGVKSWMIGVANVRGSLLPLMDLKVYVHGEEVVNNRTSKVIVIDYKGFNTGLIVEEVFGLKHFLVKSETKKAPKVHKNISPYVRVGFKDEKKHWAVFSLTELAKEDKFLQAAL